MATSTSLSSTTFAILIAAASSSYTDPHTLGPGWQLVASDRGSNYHWQDGGKFVPSVSLVQAQSACKVAGFALMRYDTIGSRAWCYSQKSFSDIPSTFPKPGMDWYSYQEPETGNDNPCSAWSNGLKTDIPGIGLGGTWVTNLDACKNRCTADSRCKAAQFCDGAWWSCSYTANGRKSNCFIYSSTDDSGPQLKYPIANTQGSFLLYKYTKGTWCPGSPPGSWSPAIYRDIRGIGLGGSYAYNLQQCMQRCVSDIMCQAAQYSKTNNYQGSNCFIYSNQNINAIVDENVIPLFYLYKFNRGGCGSNCCPDGVTPKNWWGGGCNCGSNSGCCPDKVTPNVPGLGCGNLNGPGFRRLSEASTPSTDKGVITV